jgi:hypothetical protein
MWIIEADIDVHNVAVQVVGADLGLVSRMEIGNYKKECRGRDSNPHRG